MTILGVTAATPHPDKILSFKAHVTCKQLNPNPNINLQSQPPSTESDSTLTQALRRFVENDLLVLKGRWGWAHQYMGRIGGTHSRHRWKELPDTQVTVGQARFGVQGLQRASNLGG